MRLGAAGEASGEAMGDVKGEGCVDGGGEGWKRVVSGGEGARTRASFCWMLRVAERSM